MIAVARTRENLGFPGMRVPTVVYKGITYTYQPAFRIIVISIPEKNWEIQIALPPVQKIRSLWKNIREPLRKFYIEVYKMGHNVDLGEEEE